MDKTNMDLGELIKYYQIFNRTEGKSPRTIDWYDESLGNFYNWLSAGGRPLVLGAVNANVVREYILYLQERIIHGRKLRATTISVRVRALRAFFNWLYQSEYTEIHLLQNVKPPRLPKMLVDTLSDEEIAAIFAHLDKMTLTGGRNIAILALLLDSGLRISELAGLKLKDIHLEEQYVKVMGKGSKERMVAFGSTARKALVYYLIHFRGEPANLSIEHFFLTSDALPMKLEAIRSTIRRAGDVANVPRLHPHLCRHTYATNFLVNGGNVLLLKQNLGHTTLAMVDRYVHLATSRVAVLSQDYSPLDKLNIKGLSRGLGNDKGKLDILPKVFQGIPVGNSKARY